MSLDVIHDRKKSWKASQADYDDVFSRSNRLCSVCLTEQQIVALLSMTEFLYWPTRWVKASGDVDRQIVEEFAERLERNLMMACCDDNLPIQYRYSNTGVLERSLNAGGNWTESPEYDPRVYSPQFPVLPAAEGEDPKCVAATGAAALIKGEVGSQITGDMTRYTLAQLISDWIKTYIGTSDPFRAFLTVIANQIFALVLSALIPALTDDVYDKLKCALFCNMGDDISVNNAQWAQVRSDITGQISGIAGIFLEHLIYLLGTGGTTNLLRAGGAATGDCSECCAACDLSNWAITVFGGNNVGTEIARGSNYITIQTESVSGFGGGLFAMLTSNGDSVCCHYMGYEILSGETGVQIRGRYCDEGRWPAGDWHTIAVPDDINTFVVYGPTTSVIKVLFG